MINHLSNQQLTASPFFTSIHSPVIASWRRLGQDSLPQLKSVERGSIVQKGDHMKFAVSKFTLVLGIILTGALLSASAFAGCGDQGKSKHGASLLPQSWNGQLGSFLPISTSSSDDPIVGMWHVTFTAEGNEAGPPDNTPIDNSLVVWHSDHTEIMASSRPAQDGDICLGVWERTGRSKYKLNHLPWLGGSDTTNAPSGIGNPTGPTRLLEEVTLSPDGKHYCGRFTLDAFDTTGNLTAHIVGVVTATRVTVDTTVQDLL
jgi:hypothetical protein